MAEKQNCAKAIGLWLVSACCLALQVLLNRGASSDYNRFYPFFESMSNLWKQRIGVVLRSKREDREQEQGGRFLAGVRRVSDLQ